MAKGINNNENKKEGEEYEGHWTPDDSLTRKDKERHEADLIRLASNFTFSRIEKYEDLNAKTEKEGDKKFQEKTREFWKELIAHGLILNGKDNQPTISNFSDMDGDASVGLIKLAGIDASKIDYVRQGDSVEGKVNIDTGNVWGLALKDGGKTMLIDHHGPDAKSGTSATELTYKILTELDLLKKEKYLDEMVKFVTNIDNADYVKTLNKKFFENDFSNTLVGLKRHITFDSLHEFFKPRTGKTKGGKNFTYTNNPWKILSESELKELGKDKIGDKTILEISKQQKKGAEFSVKRLDWLDKNGFVLNSGRYGKIIIDIGGKVGFGFEAAVACGYDTYIKWAPNKNMFGIYSTKEITDDFSRGTSVRGKIWISGFAENEKLPDNLLAEILGKMTDGKIKLSDNLLAVISGNSKIKIMTEKIKQEEKIEQKKPESASVPESLSMNDVDGLLTENLNIYSSLNSFYKTDVFKDVDFEDRIKYRIKLKGIGVENEKFDEIAYGKATLGEKILNFTTFGLAKKYIGLMKSKERGLLNKDVFNKEIEGKEIEVGQNKEERSDTEKLIGNFNKELSPEDLGKRRIVKRFEFVDGKIIKTVQASRTEQGMIDAVIKLRDEKIKEADNFGGDLIKLKEQFEKHLGDKGKFENLKYLSAEGKEELRTKMSEEEANIGDLIKNKEAELENKLSIFKEPLEERMIQTGELLDKISKTLDGVKEESLKLFNSLKEINSEIKDIEKSNILGETKKQVIDNLILARNEMDNNLLEFVKRKTELEKRNNILLINKRDLSEELSKINKIGKTKKEIAERAKAKKEYTGEEDKKEKKEMPEDVAENRIFMEGQKIGEEEKKAETKIKPESIKQQKETDVSYDLNNEEDKLEINKIIGDYLNKKAPQKKKDKGWFDGFVKNIFRSLFEIKKIDVPINKKRILKETDIIFKKNQKKEAKERGEV